MKYITDYRSAPSGYGQIPGFLNITAPGCGLHNSLPNLILQKHRETMEDHMEYCNLLERLGVTTVVDSELKFDFELDKSEFTLSEWKDLVSNYY